MVQSLLAGPGKESSCAAGVGLSFRVAALMSSGGLGCPDSCRHDHDEGDAMSGIGLRCFRDNCCQYFRDGMPAQCYAAVHQSSTELLSFLQPSEHTDSRTPVFIWGCGFGASRLEASGWKTCPLNIRTEYDETCWRLPPAWQYLSLPLHWPSTQLIQL